MAAAKKGDRVKVHYTGRLEDGKVFDSTAERGPLEFVIGEGGCLRGFEAAVVGMEPGASLSATMPAADGFGERREELVVPVPREELPDHIRARVGMILRMNPPNGPELTVQVTEVSHDAVTLDANHPLAGKPLTFEIELLEILEASSEAG